MESRHGDHCFLIDEHGLSLIINGRSHWSRCRTVQKRTVRVQCRLRILLEAVVVDARLWLKHISDFAFLQLRSRDPVKNWL